MQENKEGRAFQYVYSAKEQNAIKAIRDKYLPPEQDKMRQLARLDARVTAKATAISILIGVIGALIFGVGLCCVLVWGGGWFLPGVMIGTMGLVVLGVAYPAFLHVLRIERTKAAPEILRLSEELLR